MTPAVTTPPAAPETTTPPPVPTTAPPAAPARPARHTALLHDIDWDTYRRVLKAFERRPAFRFAYDRGRLEIMSPSLEHDAGDRTLARLVIALTEELGLPVYQGGSTTLRRRKKGKGIEADNVFWVANAGKVAGAKKLNLRIHPPPDLALEVDVSHSSIDRLRVYAALKVPEVWRLDGDRLVIHVLAGKAYAESAESVTFPGVAVADLAPFVQKVRAAANQNAAVSAFRQWVRQKFAPPST